MSVEELIALLQTKDKKALVYYREDTYYNGAYHYIINYVVTDSDGDVVLSEEEG